MNSRDLFEAARQARTRAFAPYSKFQVGAAISAKSGKVYTGCNIEISSYGLTMCAERVALFKAVSEGERDFQSIAVAGAEPDLSCCGACRQVLWDFAENLVVVTEDKAGKIIERSLRDLLPLAFGKNDLKLKPK